MLYLNCVLLLCSFQLTLANPINVDTQNIELEHSIIFDNEVHLKWSYNSSYIVMQLTCKTCGWMGVGISTTGSMAGADIAVMWSNGQDITLLDMYAAANGAPIMDASQNLDLITGSTTDDETTVVFGRKLTACDDYDNAISEDTLRVIYAYGDNKPNVRGKFNDKFYHGIKRGSRSLRLLSQQATHDPKDEGVKTIEFINIEVNIPQQVTYYHCKLFEFDLEASKQHVVKIEPIVQTGNELFVHHALVYICDGLENTTLHNHPGHECNTPNMPDDYKTCRKLIYAWAIGGGPYAYPDHVGFPLDNVNGKAYLMMEMHYDNPKEVSGKIDSSGIKVHYTPNLRENEAGILEIGTVVSPLHFIPAGATDWLTYAECRGDCLASGMAENQDKVKIIAVLLHSHLFGRRLKLHHYRNGVELKPISSEQHYDFNYQEYNVFSEEIDFLKGDSLAMECVYDTSESSVPIFGGLGTDEEMCLGFVLYYPKLQNISSCYALSNPEDQSAYLGLNMSINLSQWFNEKWFKEYNTSVYAGEFGMPLTDLNKAVNDASFYQLCESKLDFPPNLNYTNYQEPEPNCDVTTDPPNVVSTTSSGSRIEIFFITGPFLLWIIVLSFAY